jgi:hypothetical protein
MSEFSDLEALIKSAERSIARGDFDAAEAGIDYVNSVIRKAKQSQSSDDDEAEDDYDDPSNPSADADDDDDGDDGEDDEDDDDSEPVTKAWHEHSNAGSPHRMRGQRVREQVPETYRLSATPPVEGPGKRSKFEALVDHVADRDNVPKHVAMTTARHQYPQTYVTYQRQLSDRSSRRQAKARGYHMMAAKSAPTCWEESVAQEMARSGVNEEIAKVRLAQAHGFPVMRTRMFAKTAEDITKRFQAEVFKIYDADGSCTLEEATREARLQHPQLMKALSLLT